MPSIFSLPRLGLGVRAEILSPQMWPVLDYDSRSQSRFRFWVVLDAVERCPDRGPSRPVYATSRIGKDSNEARSSPDRGHSGRTTHDPLAKFRLRPFERSNRERRLRNHM